MNTATLSFARLPGTTPRDVLAHPFWSRGPRLDADDFRAVALAFAVAAGLVLGGALACDGYLIALIARGPATLDDLAAYQFARALLPWSCLFTAIAASLAAGGLAVAYELRRRASDGAPAGFDRMVAFGRVDSKPGTARRARAA